MNNCKKKFTPLQSEIFELLSKYTGRKLSQRQIAGLLKVSPAGVGKALKGLKHFIKTDKSILNVHLVELSRDPEAVRLKHLVNLRILYESKIIEYLEEKAPGCAIVLFGSFARGEDLVNSDVDIAIIGSKRKSLQLESFEKALMRTVNVNFFSSLKILSKEFRESICNGIVLANSIEL